MKINEIINNIDKDEIRKIFNEHFTYDGEITIDDNGFISCSGVVNLVSKLSKLPVKFLKVDGDFNCSNNQLTTLVGSPTSVGGHFDCANNKLITLVGSPASVDGGFYCHDNQLTTLAGGPTSVDGSFDCSSNQLTTLVGSPTSVGGYFDCHNNNLETLAGCPTSVGKWFDCYNNPNLKNLNHLSTGISDLYLSYSPTMPLLRCLIAEAVRVDPKTDTTTQIKDVLNKYAGQGRKAALDCAADLLSLGKKLGIDLTMNARW